LRGLVVNALKSTRFIEPGDAHGPNKRTADGNGAGAIAIAFNSNFSLPLTSSTSAEAVAS
jgi:hypothetical protein